MKVLFAVHDEKVSLSIVKKYQKVYKEIISYKNVYYFNAIFIQQSKIIKKIRKYSCYFLNNIVWYKSKKIEENRK